jgi:hypothetical protein
MGNWNHFRITQTNLRNTHGNHEIKELGGGKKNILDTAHILRKVLMEKYKTYFTGNITLHVA